MWRVLGVFLPKSVALLRAPDNAFSARTWAAERFAMFLLLTKFQEHPSFLSKNTTP